jgi:hypothetical protein
MDKRLSIQLVRPTRRASFPGSALALNPRFKRQVVDGTQTTAGEDSIEVPVVKLQINAPVFAERAYTR